MAIGFHIVDGLRNIRARVSFSGELITRGSFQTAEKVTLTIDDTPVNILKPRAGQQSIITGIIVNTNRDIGVNGSLIEIYEATTETTGTVAKAIMSFDLIKNQTVASTPLLIQTTEGAFINAKASDSEVNITLISYLVPVDPNPRGN